MEKNESWWLMKNENLFLSIFIILERNRKTETVKIWDGCIMQCFAIHRKQFDCNHFLDGYKYFVRKRV